MTNDLNVYMGEQISFDRCQCFYLCVGNGIWTAEQQVPKEGKLESCTKYAKALSERKGSFFK